MMERVKNTFAEQIFRVRLLSESTKRKERKMTAEKKEFQMSGANSQSQDSREPVRKVAKVGRNDPCPCGSGKKYKHCHGRGL